MTWDLALERLEIDLARKIPPFLYEMCFRFNKRKNPYLFRDTITKLIASRNIEYKDPIAKVEDAA
jgi:hypothetical protein